MVVNPMKTEVVIFGKGNLANIELIFANNRIKTSESLKALSITMSGDLKWDQHLAVQLPKSHAKLSLLKKIQNTLTSEQFIKIATSQVFSTIYYASPVWLNTTLSSKLWKKVTSFHYRVMRVACNDHKARKKRIVIDSICKRATPRMWSDYITASIAMKIIRDQAPLKLANTIRDSMTIERRKPSNPRFFDSSRIRHGRHSFANRLKHFSDISLPWYDPCPNPDNA